MKRNVWLKEETVEMLNLARVKFVTENPESKPYDDTIINEALKVYTNEPNTECE